MSNFLEAVHNPSQLVSLPIIVPWKPDAKGITGEQFSSTTLYSEGLKTESIDHLPSLAKRIQTEIANS